ncbi:4'-phosphopantetheinyl transferase family protein [Alteromonas ponticola]|uniref:4'-phosphopantetheinyl transferase superfamily protein n=1 Tax=Alteromonas ponticola TaxID=2720613 RepID=A0ABX1R5X3_9ALTE|nr:4'-phosphopantetheinyl transferase superfamily protein [Alteromonas ponticola]NMH60658.1 4'-phosphopantetheinyl transferase superfamily protein [Alteromonas ponticola]
MSVSQNSPKLALSSDEIHLWLIDFDDVSPAALTTFADYLSEDEKQRMAGFRSVKRQQQFFITRGALRTILSDYIPITTPNSLRFSVDSWGKPTLENRHGLQFNLSHSKSKVIIGVARQRLLGVDIEHMRASRNVENIARDYFHPSEWDGAITDKPWPHSASHHFYKLWALKEALTKAEGKGMALPFDTFYFSDVHTNQLKLRPTAGYHPSKDWRFYHQYIADDYSLAVAYEQLKVHGETKIVFKQYQR